MKNEDNPYKKDGDDEFFKCLLFFCLSIVVGAFAFLVFSCAFVLFDVFLQKFAK